MRRALSVYILKQSAAGNLAQNFKRGTQAWRRDLLIDRFAAFGAEAKPDRLAIQFYIRLEQRSGAAGAALFGIDLAPGPNRASRHEFDDAGERQFAGRRASGQVLRDAAADPRQAADEAFQALGLARFAHLFPFR